MTRRCPDPALLRAIALSVRTMTRQGRAVGHPCGGILVPSEPPPTASSRCAAHGSRMALGEIDGWREDRIGLPIVPAPWLDATMDWLLDGEVPAVRHRALRELLDRPADDRDVAAARAAAMRTPPISTILEAQDPEGWWVEPGPGYLPKYRSTVWQLTFLDQLGADPEDERIRNACRYVIDHAQTAGGGFGIRLHGLAAPPPSARTSIRRRVWTAAQGKVAPGQAPASAREEVRPLPPSRVPRATASADLLRR